MKFSAIHKTNGLSLIEVIIYVSIFSMMIFFISVSVYKLLDVQKSGGDRSAIEADLDFVIGKIDWAILSTNSINSPSAGATGTVLSLNKLNYGQNPIVFDVSGGEIRISKGGSTPTSITGSDLSVSKFEVKHLQEIGTRPAGIEVNITAIASTTRQIAASTTINNTFYLNK